MKQLSVGRSKGEVEAGSRRRAPCRLCDPTGNPFWHCIFLERCACLHLDLRAQVTADAQACTVAASFPPRSLCLPRSVGMTTKLEELVVTRERVVGPLPRFIDVPDGKLLQYFQGEPPRP